MFHLQFLDRCMHICDKNDVSFNQVVGKSKINPEEAHKRAEALKAIRKAFRFMSDDWLAEMLGMDIETLYVLTYEPKMSGKPLLKIEQTQVEKVEEKKATPIESRAERERRLFDEKMRRHVAPIISGAFKRTNTAYAMAEI